MNIKTNSKLKLMAFVLLSFFVLASISFAADTTVVSGTLQGEDTTSNTSLTSSGKGIGSLFNLSQSFLSRALTLLISLAVVWFMWNVFRYAIAADEIDKAVAKDKMVWGIIAIFVIVSIWGLVAILENTFQIFPSSSGPTINSIMPTINL